MDEKSLDENDNNYKIIIIESCGSRKSAIRFVLEKEQTKMPEITGSDGGGG